MENDQRLIERVLAGERAAFRELIASYERLVQHVVFRLVLDRRDAEEVCQDVFLRVYRGLANFRGEAKLSTWIARIAHRSALKHLEKRRLPRAPEFTSDDHSTVEIATPATQLDDVVRAELRAFTRARVAVLPPEYRAAVTLYHLEGMSVAEVAEVMQLPSGTVKSHLFRARKLLKAMVEERLGGSCDE